MAAELKTYLVEHNGMQFTAQFTAEEAKNLGLKEASASRPAKGAAAKKESESK